MRRKNAAKQPQVVLGAGPELASFADRETYRRHQHHVNCGAPLILVIPKGVSVDTFLAMLARHAKVDKSCDRCQTCGCGLSGF